MRKNWHAFIMVNGKISQDKTKAGFWLNAVEFQKTKEFSDFNENSVTYC